MFDYKNEDVQFEADRLYDRLTLLEVKVKNYLQYKKDVELTFKLRDNVIDLEEQINKMKHILESGLYIKGWYQDKNLFTVLDHLERFYKLVAEDCDRFYHVYEYIINNWTEAR